MLAAVSESSAWRERAAATRRQRSEERILAAARELFEAYGFDAVTVEEIAGSAGVGPATVYQRFGTKAAIAATIMAEMTRPAFTAAERDAFRLPAGEAIRRHLRRVAQVFCENREMARALLSAVLHTTGPPIDSRDPRLVFPLPSPLAVLLQAGIDTGEIQVPTSASDTAATLTSLLLVRIMSRQESPRASADFVWQISMKGIER